MMDSGQFKILTKLKEEFKTVASGDHPLALKPVEIEEMHEIDVYTLFSFEPIVGNREALDQARRVVYEEVIMEANDR